MNLGAGQIFLVFKSFAVDGSDRRRRLRSRRRRRQRRQFDDVLPRARLFLGDAAAAVGRRRSRRRFGADERRQLGRHLGHDDRIKTRPTTRLLRAATRILDRHVQGLPGDPRAQGHPGVLGLGRQVEDRGSVRQRGQFPGSGYAQVQRPPFTLQGQPGVDRVELPEL